MKNKDMEINLTVVAISFWSKLTTILSSCGGWVAATIGSIIAFFAGIKTMVLILSGLVIADFIFGIIVNRKHILSSKFRNTVIKFAFYVILLMGIYAIEFEVGLGVLILTPLLFSISGIAELLSIISNMIILRPDLPILSIFKKILQKEISSKIEHLEGVEMENILNPKKK